MRVLTFRGGAAALLILAQLISALLIWGTPARSSQKVVVGVLPFSSSGPVFLALDRGYFRDEGLDVDLALFQAAPPIAMATAADEVTFGVTAITAAAFNLAAENRIKFVAGQAQEKKGHSGNLILVTKEAYDRGIDSLEELFEQPFGLTQMGSPSHYQLGQLADGQGIESGDLDIRAFQTLPNLVAALKSAAITWAIIAPPIATDLIELGAVVSLGPYSDYGSFQFGAVFTSAETVNNNPYLVRRFLRAYAKGLSDYSEIVQRPNSDRALVAAGVVGRYVYPDLGPEEAARKVLGSAFFLDPTGQVDVKDIQRQIDWYYRNGILGKLPVLGSFIRLEFLP